MKNHLSLFLVLILAISLFAGCSNKPAEGTAAPEASAAAPEASAAPTEAEEPLERNSVKLPLTTEPVTFVYWCGNSMTFDGFADYEDNLVYQEMERRTGVNMDFIHPVTGSENEAFQLLIVSDNLPDFIQGLSSYYVGGVDKAIQDGVVVRLNELVEKYMPNYNYHVNFNEDIKRQSLTDSGNLWAIHHIVDRPQGAWAGLGIRQDWLDDAGLEKPVYYSELENVLTAFLDFTPNRNGPLYLANGGNTYGFTLCGSYNVAGTEYINVDGQVRYSPMEPGYKEYLMKMADWYNKGLIDKNSVTNAVNYVPSDEVINGNVGVFDYIYTFSSIYKISATDPDFRVVALTTPIPDGKTAADVHVRMDNPWVRTNISAVITTACENLELACKYWDYLFSDEGIILGNYGVEGVSFEYGDDGKPYYTEEALSYNNITYTQLKYALHSQPVYTIWSRELSVLDEDQQAAEAIWGVVDAAYIMPRGVTLTEEEGFEHASLKSEMDTYVSENQVLFITGQKSFDEWDDFISTLKGLGVDRAVELQQGALDRYFARGK